MDCLMQMQWSSRVGRRGCSFDGDVEVAWRLGWELYYSGEVICRYVYGEKETPEQSYRDGGYLWTGRYMATIMLNLKACLGM